MSFTEKIDDAGKLDIVVWSRTVAVSEWANELIDAPDRRVPCLVGCDDTFDDQLNLVVHLNDVHSFTFNEIADYLERNGENYEIQT
jgi:hypothetical protein